MSSPWAAIIEAGRSAGQTCPTNNETPIDEYGEPCDKFRWHIERVLARNLHVLEVKAILHSFKSERRNDGKIAVVVRDFSPTVLVIIIATPFNVRPPGERTRSAQTRQKPGLIPWSG